MQTLTCINKIRDNSKVIKKYVLRDVSSGQIYHMDRDTIKGKISNHEWSITNLRIDEQGRLIDCADNTQSQNQHKEYFDLINKLKIIYDYIKNFENFSKTNDDKLITGLGNIYKRCKEIDERINQILQQLNEQEQSESIEPTLSNQIDNIQSYLLENANDLEQIKNSISDLTNQINNLSDEEDNGHKKLLTEDGSFEMPEDSYSRFWYDRYFKSVDTSTIEFNNEELLSELREEIEKSYKAYIDTESFYLAQLADYSDKYNNSQLLATMTGALADKFENMTGVTPDILKESAKEFTYSMASLCPGIDTKAKQKRAISRFSNKDNISQEKARNILANVGGIWNNAIDFIYNNPEWEIMLYVIQTMNHYYLHTFSVNTGTGYDTVESVNGKMNTYVDTTWSNKKSKALTEQALSIVYEELNNISQVQDKEYECYKHFYDRFIVSYFAAKKVLYKRNMFPFNNMSTQAVNGLQIKITEIALKLCNVQDYLVEMKISTLCNSNNHKDNPKYHIDRNVKISDYL